MVDPTEGSRIPVNASIAATLDPVAATFYRSFGDKRRAWDLVRFGLDFYRKDVLMIVMYAVAGALLGMVIPQATAILFGQAIPDANRGLVLQVALGMAAALLGAMLFDLTRSISALRVQSGTTITLQAAVWDWLLKLSPTFFRDFSVGELRAHAEGVTRILDQLKPATLVIIASGLSSSLYIVLMLYYSISLGLLGLVIGMVILVATAVSSIFLGRLEGSLQQMEGAISGLMVQLINAVPKLRVVGAEQRAFAYWGKLYSRKQRVVNQIQQIRDRLRVMNVTLPILATGLAFGFAFDAVDVGTFLAFSLALGVFIKATSELSDTFASLVSIRTHWRRTKRILDVQPEAGSGKVHPGRLTGRLMLDHVTFRYGKHGPLTLEDVSLHAEPGECIALVGPSGAGKSTILNLLLGFEIPASGGVYVDGHDLGSLDLVAVRRQFGVVRQDSNSMADSIFQNIVCGSRCTMSEAWEAVRAAGLADDIEQMPMGMHTVIAEGGTNISVGQRQRLLIARALALKPRILLFDEATSALDNRTQQIVTESIARLKATRVVVAHRLSTIRQADRIYVIESGRIVQEGTFDELSRKPGLFLRLMKRQMA